LAHPATDDKDPEKLEDKLRLVFFRVDLCIEGLLVHKELSEFVTHLKITPNELDILYEIERDFMISHPSQNSPKHR